MIDENRWDAGTPSDVDGRTIGATSRGPDSGIRELTDPKAMRALAHPLRGHLLELLLREGPLTATEAADLTGESPASCSFHLRTLARHGFVTEAEGGAGRRRPWRLTTVGNRWEERPDAPAASAAGSLLSAYVCERDLARVLGFVASRDPDDPFDSAATVSDSMAYLTADELTALSADLEEVLMRHRERLVDRSARPPGSRAVHLVAWAFPLPPTPGETPS